jgi:hypothetical protein
LWVIVALSSLAAFIILVLCVPLDITLHIDTSEKPRSRMRLVWLFGLVSKEIRRAQKKPREKRGELKGKRQFRGRRRRIRTVLAILGTKGLVTQLKDLVMGTLSRLEIRQLGVNFRVGLDDPADMGFLFAFIGPATRFLSSFSYHQIRVHPSFGDEAVFEGHLYGAVRLRPIRLVPTFMRFALSLATIRAVKTLVLTKWKNKK